MSASYEDLVHALAHDKGNISHSLRNLEVKGFIRIERAEGRAQAIDLSAERRNLFRLLRGRYE
jgi:hypothetical protein